MGPEEKDGRGDDLEALQARARTLQAEIAAERRHAAAAEAVIAASRAAVEEAGLATASPRSHRAARRWVLGLGGALVLCASVLVGLTVRSARMLEALETSRAAQRRVDELDQREVIELERRLSQERLTRRACRTSYGQSGGGAAGSSTVR